VTRTPPVPLERLAAQAGLTPAELRLYLREQITRRRRPSLSGKPKGQLDKARLC
jgi:hypothetical protein